MRKSIKAKVRRSVAARATARALRSTQGTISARRSRSRVTRTPAAFVPSMSEIKAIDIASASYLFRDPATATNIALLNGVQTGAAFYNRVGARIELRNLHIRGTIKPTATSNGETTIRMLVVYDRQPTGALPACSDILQMRDQTGATSTTGYSEINLDNRDRFVIIRDMQWYAPSLTDTAGQETNLAYPGFGSNNYDVNEFIRLSELGTHFKSSSNPTTIADIATGALYVLFTTTAGNDSQYTFAGNFRLRYDDR